MRWSPNIGLPVGMILGIVLALWGASQARAETVPLRAAMYQASLTREARFVMGLNAPVAVFAGQIEQESGWRAKVCSPFACGLTQFTPGTAKGMAKLYPDELGSADVFDPIWAIRALVRYDRDLYAGVPRDVSIKCDRWAFALSAYNGGPKWIERDRALARAHGANPSRWWGNVEKWTPRAPKYAKENRGYPRIILLRNQDHYTTWGGYVEC